MHSPAHVHFQRAVSQIPIHFIHSFPFSLAGHSVHLGRSKSDEFVGRGLARRKWPCPARRTPANEPDMRRPNFK